MTRAACWLEAVGIPAVPIVCEGFTRPAMAIANLEGLDSLRSVELPAPNVATQTTEEIYTNAGIILDEIIKKLTTNPPPARASRKRVRDEQDIVFEGTLEEVNEFFNSKGWGDGLPIIPPTPEKVAEMLKYTSRDAREVVAVLEPAGTEATVWSVAVNGVMAGCRPSYMPILLAIVEAIGEERFSLTHAGSTSGWTPLIVLNGPIRNELGFNSGQGVLRPGNQANMSIGRFLALVWRNLAGFKLGTTDLAAIGRNFMPVLCENEEASPYDPLSVDFGFEKGKNTVMVQSCGSMSFHFTTEATPEEHLHYLAWEMKNDLGGEFLHPMVFFGDESHPALLLSPMVANMLAEAGYTKQDIRDYIFEHTKITAEQFNDQVNREQPGYDIDKCVREGFLPEYYLGDDPQRLVPVMRDRFSLNIIVAGYEARNRSAIIRQIAHQGLPVAKEIILPDDWENMPK